MLVVTRTGAWPYLCEYNNMHGLVKLVAQNAFFSLWSNCSDTTERRQFSIVKEKPNLALEDKIKVEWIECTFPTNGLNKIKDCISNSRYNWKKEVIKMAKSPFSQVIPHI